MRVRLILNEKSRRGAESAPGVRAALDELNVEIVEREPYDAIVAAGGDGTIVSSLAEAMQAKVPLGIIPLGTFNDLARTFGIPLDVPGACAIVAGGTTREIDVGRVNGAYFVNEASIGISTRIARRQTPELKQRFGFFGVAGTTIQTLAQHRPFFAEVDFDGRSEQFRTVQLTFANSYHFGGLIEVPGGSIDNGMLELFSVEIENWLGVIPIVRKAITHDRGSVDGLRRRRSNRFTVHTHRPHHISADGEPAGVTPAVFESIPRALRIIVPKPPAPQ
ncbi:MAG TPA: YegS/Rv2252/BmrU family lipid kinase [Candidatus Baltobacteraceae bacterium]|jgi:YegS/Rv2252/BmrU family lipid kinase